MNCNQELIKVHTVQSQFSDIKFSDNLLFSGYFRKDNFSIYYKEVIIFSDIMRFSDSFLRDQKCH